MLFNNYYIIKSNIHAFAYKYRKKTNHLIIATYFNKYFTVNINIIDLLFVMSKAGVDPGFSNGESESGVDPEGRG